jgi:DNA repair protein RadD
MNLRPYQRQAIDALYHWFNTRSGNPLLVLPTGTGKSLVLAAFCQEAIEAYPQTRIVVVTHVRELIQQNVQEMLRLWPDAPVGIYSAGLGKRQIGAQVLFAGIQSIHKRAYEVQQADLVLVDEAHLIPRNSDTMYRRFLDTLGEINPDMKIIGLTATPYRLDSGRLDRGQDAFFQGIAFDYSIARAIDEGYLAPVSTKRTETQLDVSDVGKRGGDFVPSQLERAVDQDSTTAAAVQEIVAHGQTRQSWLVFCAGVDHAHHVRDAMRQAGYAAESVTGETPKAERDRAIRDFKAGRLRCLTNANVLTTGFNAPQVDLLAMLRPTQSTGLYVQMVGRGTRRADGKDDCLVLDFAGNIDRHGPIDNVNPSSPPSSDGDGEAPVKTCEGCDMVVHASVRECPHCGHEFPEPQPELQARASKAAILSSQIEAEWVPVMHVAYRRHQKPGKPDSMRVEYVCGLATHREWVCLEHGGYPREKAVKWWRRRLPGSRVPTTVGEALNRADQELPKPAQIAIKPSGKHTEIVDAWFEDDLQRVSA